VAAAPVLVRKLCRGWRGTAGPRQASTQHGRTMVHTVRQSASPGGSLASSLAQTRTQGAGRRRNPALTEHAVRVGCARVARAQMRACVCSCYGCYPSCRNGRWDKTQLPPLLAWIWRARRSTTLWQYIPLRASPSTTLRSWIYTRCAQLWCAVGTGAGEDNGIDHNNN
jgi:hypothetical protein